MFLNEYRGQYKENQQKKLALEMVEIELKSNLDIVKDWLPYHEQVLKGLNEELKSESSNKNLFNENAELIASLMPQGVIQQLIDNGAWQTLKDSSVSSTIDFQTMLTLSKLYKLQSIGVESTLGNIVEILASREALDLETQRNTIMLLRNAFRELVGQEKFLIQKYEQALVEIGMQESM